MQEKREVKTILTYDDIIHVTPGSSKETLVDVRTHDSEIISEYSKFDMLDVTGDVIYLRDTLSQKLGNVNRALKSGGYVLKVAYGYRHPSVQTRYFESRKAILADQHPLLNEEELNSLTHNFVAVPNVGGHPAGAAIDLTLADRMTHKELDMGTGIADYSDPLLIRTFDTRLSDEQMTNRMLLHDAMIAEDFAPFYGEWWHFSYGDREWGAFYDKEAIYGQIDFRTIGKAALQLP